MAEESLRGEEKEMLRRRLELLQKEYERTAQRLQRAERKAAVRRHVQNRISDENRQLQINTTGLSQLSPASSSVSNTNLLSNQPLQSEIKPDYGSLSSKKHPLVRFHLPDGSDDSPCSTPTCRQSPTHRLRSKRSRLRLQSKEKEADIDSQDKAKEGVEERLGEKRNCNLTTKENGVEVERGGEKEQADITGGDTVEEKIQNGDPEVTGSDGEIGKEQQREVLHDRLSKGDRNSDVRLQMCSISDNASVNQVPGEVFPISQVEVKASLGNQSADINSQSSSSASDQLFMQIRSCQSTGLSEQSDNQQADDTKREVKGAGMDSVDEINAPFSSEKNGILDSCTLVEGLPFPVEYYVRTTRRMAAAHSPVDLNAVILSQLSRGRGRRRSSSSQARGSNHLTSEDSQPHGKSLDQPRCRGRGRRGRRGRRRTRVEGVTKSSQARSCTDDFSEMEPESLTETSLTESSTQSPQSQSLLQTSLPGGPSPQLEPASQTELILTPKPVLNTQPEAADFKHLSDSQLYLDCKFLPDCEVYPIFRRRRSQTERAGSCSQVQTSTNGKDCRPLLSLVSLAQALKMTNCTPLGQLLTSSDIQDFHLPDDEFGQLKLQRLCTSCLNVEPLSSHYSANNTRCNSPRYSFRNLRNKNSAEGQRTDNELFSPELLPPSAHLEGSFDQSEIRSADQLLMPRNPDQSEKHTKSANQLKSDTGSQKSCQSSITCLAEVSQGTKDHIPLRNTKDEKTPVAYNYKEFEEDAGKQKHDLKTCEELEQDNGSPCPAVLNFSMTLTPHMEHGPDSSLPSLGIIPYLLSSVSPSDFSLIQPAPSDQSVSLYSFQHAENSSPAVPAFNQASSAGQNVCGGTLQSQSQTTERDLQTLPGSEPANEAWLSPVTKTPLQNVYNMDSSISENCHRATDVFEGENQYLDTQTGKQSPIQPEPKLEDQREVQREGSSPLQSDSSCVNKPCSSDPSVVQTAGGESVLVMNMADTGHKLTEHTLGMENSALVSQRMDTETTCQSQAAEDMRNSDKAISYGTFQKAHRFKTLEGGCVLDVCSVRWPSDDCCVCVAGEWSVCVWAQKTGVQQWSLIHTWTFAQSIISLQEVPDSSGLLCVSLGSLEITEVRILHCSSIDGEFSQAEACKGALQAVVAVSDCRLVCCSAPGAQQKVQVFTLSQDCRVSDVLCLVSTSRSIQTLAAVEREKDALIGWTECKTLLIWNMKSGQLLQSIHLTEAVSTATCLKGYSYKGALCVLFQSASSNPCLEENDAVLFTLIALNPLTGKHFTLTSVTSPPASCSERLIDGDVCESMLAGVFQSGHLTIWDLKGDVAGVLGGVEAQSCRLARWAGPSTLLTGYLNGDVHLYQFKPTESKTNCR
ncbi:partner and localizer of BRCA2 [Astyanax mexicanus]|uniref:Partner and localizer of BRCA2 n=1 Tax=Astyanax mexicanus TaxID=7994 RepID=A0A8B9K3G9_ASTMX|nr:partner and localizer of BRCA2 [Astyanax mexicanus]